MKVILDRMYSCSYKVTCQRRGRQTVFSVGTRPQPGNWSGLRSMMGGWREERREYTADQTDASQNDKKQRNIRGKTSKGIIRTGIEATGLKTAERSRD